MRKRIFAVEDDDMFQRLLKHTLELNPEHEVFIFSTGKECLDNLKLNPTLITLDYSLPDMTGAQILKKIKTFNPDIPVIVLSGQQDISTAIELLKEGAYDYITKDADTRQKLIHTVNHVYQNQSLKKEVESLREELSEKHETKKIIFGESGAINKVFSLIEKAAKTNITVSVTGETGTGKEVVAKAIHHNSSRNKKPFVAVNLAAIPKELMESELFGHEKGAFTGAQNRRIGKFEQADGGTIFLDEIGEMEISLQAKILRVLQEMEITRVGGNATIKIDARVIVATNRDLKKEVSKNNFREDLYYRILGFPILLPPLRERGNDILILSRKFMDNFCNANGLPKMDISLQAKEKLMKHSFPGNVRELKSIVELACVMTSDHEIREQDIQLESASGSQEFFEENATMKDYEHKIIHYYLRKHNDNVLQVAEKLNIGKSSIYRMLKEDRVSTD